MHARCRVFDPAPGVILTWGWSLTPRDASEIGRVIGGRERVKDTDVNASATRGTNIRALATIVAIMVVSCIVDQVTKFWALTTLDSGATVPLIGHFITAQLVFNSGAAFSMLNHATWVFTIFSAVICLGGLVVMPRVRNLWWAIAVGFLLGGAWGNLIDRLIQAPGFGVGHVVDFLNWNNWFVGNVADIWIVGAAVALVLLGLLGVPYDRSGADQRHAPSSADSRDGLGA